MARLLEHSWLSIFVVKYNILYGIPYVILYGILSKYRILYRILYDILYCAGCRGCYFPNPHSGKRQG